MNLRHLVPVFSATLFVSAFLIFAVQPMASKMLLPLLGGSPSVWNTAMVFFQAMLLGGYAYAHFIAKYMPLKMQGLIHASLLIIFTLVLPLSLPADAAPPENDGQAAWQLGVMLSCIGGPFFVLAASAPLFQHWFSASGHKDAENPYFLYAVSNVGSMGALLGYPLLIEPFLTLPEQTGAWFAGYIALIALTLFCSFLIRNGAKPLLPLTSANDTITNRTRLGWILLAFIPSSLMLGVTTMITTDLASAPMLWIVPLALYLATFILAFRHVPFVNLPLTRELTAYALCLVLLMFMISAFVMLKVIMILVHLAAFFLCALLCHGELANSKPRAARLTEFFLLISLGGVLGGVFNALVAPQIFTLPAEYSITLAMVPFVIWLRSVQPTISLRFNGMDDKNRATRTRLMQAFLIVVGIALCALTFLAGNATAQLFIAVGLACYLFMMVQNRLVFAVICLCAFITFQNGLWNLKQGTLETKRNYFGVLKVTEHDNIHYFYHGTTLHGAQFQDEKNKLHPVTYYSPDGPVANIFGGLKNKSGRQNIAVLGLGVGSVACYAAPGRHFDFYEIDKDVVEIAANPRYFSYLSGCGSPYDVILGDGRLKIAEQAENAESAYDLIFLDAFSSDNIPIHLLTKEAFEIYLAKLKPDGVIGINISNRYIDLRPMLSSLAAEAGWHIVFKGHEPVRTKGDVSSLYTTSVFAALAKEQAPLAGLLEDHGWKPYTGSKKVRPWTDDYANILSSLHGLD